MLYAVIVRAHAVRVLRMIRFVGEFEYDNEKLWAYS